MSAAIDVIDYVISARIQLTPRGRSWHLAFIGREIDMKDKCRYCDRTPGLGSTTLCHGCRDIEGKRIEELEEEIESLEGHVKIQVAQAEHDTKTIILLETQIKKGVNKNLNRKYLKSLEKVADFELQLSEWKQVAEDCACAGTKKEAIGIYELALKESR